MLHDKLKWAFAVGLCLSSLVAVAESASNLAQEEPAVAPSEATTQPGAAATLPADDKSGEPNAAKEEPASAQAGAEIAEVQSPEEVHLRRRVQARWDALVRNDYDALYMFASPAYRQAFSAAHFKGGYATQIKRTGIEINSVAFADEDKTKATVKLEILYVTELWGKLHNGRRHSKEAWVKVDDEWWRVEKR